MTVYALKTIVADMEGVQPDEQRLIYGSKQLEDDRLLSDYNIAAEHTVTLVLRLRGMISSFSASAASNRVVQDPSVAFLLLSDAQRAEANVPQEWLKVLATRHAANPHTGFTISSQSPFTTQDRHVLCKFLRHVWASTMGAKPVAPAGHVHEIGAAAAAGGGAAGGGSGGGGGGGGGGDACYSEPKGEDEAFAASAASTCLAASLDSAASAASLTSLDAEAVLNPATVFPSGDLKVVLSHNQLLEILCATSASAKASASAPAKAAASAPASSPAKAAASAPASAAASASAPAKASASAKAAETVQRLLNLYMGTDAQRNAKFAMRMTVGPGQACIPFHCDGVYATSTTQIALNGDDEYEGGRLVYYTFDVQACKQGTLHVVRRPAGTTTHHRPKILHAVTRMVSGERLSFFVLDAANGLGDRDVLDCSVGIAGQMLVGSFLR